MTPRAPDGAKNREIVNVTLPIRTGVGNLLREEPCVAEELSEACAIVNVTYARKKYFVCVTEK